MDRPPVGSTGEGPDAHLDEELADILALVSLELDHFTILWVLNHCPIARKLLSGVRESRHNESGVCSGRQTTGKQNRFHLTRQTSMCASLYLLEGLD